MTSMSSVFTARRRAEQFDALVGDPTAGGDARYADLLEVVGALRAVPAPSPRPDFSASLRERLMAEADTVLLPRDRAVERRLTVPARTGEKRDRRLAVAAGALAMVGATATVAVAAQSALPGDALYPVKRALEDAQAGVSVGEAAKGAALLDIAAGRLEEVSALAQRGTPEDTAAVPGTLDTFVDQVRDAAALMLEDYEKTGDTSGVEKLRDFTGASMAALQQIDGLLPSSVREELQRAAEVLAEVDALAREICPDCGGAGVAQIPPSLLTAAQRLQDVVVAPPASVSTVRPEGRTERGSKGTTTRAGNGGKTVTPPTEPAPEPTPEPAPPVTGEEIEEGVGGLIGDLGAPGDGGERNASGGGLDQLIQPITEPLIDGTGDLLQ